MSLSISLAKCRYRLFGSPILVNLTKQSSIDIKYIASYIKLSDWFSIVVLMCSPCDEQLLPILTELDQYRDCVHP